MQEKSIIVSTKKELQDAVKNNADCIIVTGDLKKNLNGLKKVYKLNPKKKAALATAITGTLAAVIGTAIAGASAAPATGGASLIVAGALESAEIPIAATSTGVGVATIVAVVVCCVTLGSVTVQSLLNTYRLEEDEVTIGGEKGIKFIRKYKSKDNN